MEKNGDKQKKEKRSNNDGPSELSDDDSEYPRLNKCIAFIGIE